MHHLSFTIKKSNFVAFFILLALTACSETTTYAPVKTVNQTIVTEDEAQLRKEKELRKLSRNKNKIVIKEKTPKQHGIIQNPEGVAPISSTDKPSRSKITALPSNQPENQRSVKSSESQKIIISDKKSNPINLHEKNKTVSVKQITQHDTRLKTTPQKTAPKPININKDANIANANPSPQIASSSQKTTITDENIKKNEKEKKSIISINNKKVLKLTFEWPIRGKIIKNFAQSDNKGIDIAGKAGQTVRAAEAGKAVYCGHGLLGYGNLIIIKHNQTYLSAYAHNSRLTVHEGQQVDKGQPISEIGLVGTKKPMLHFEIRKNGKSVNPLTFLSKH